MKMSDPLSQSCLAGGFFHLSAPERLHSNRKPTPMKPTADLSPDELMRLPGLYRRWELTEVFEPHRNYQIEDAGSHADGTPLLAIYASDPVPNAITITRTPSLASSAERTDLSEPHDLVTRQSRDAWGKSDTWYLDQRELSARWHISPRTLERWRCMNTGPTYTRLGGKVVYAIADVEAYERRRRAETHSSLPGAPR